MAVDIVSLANTWETKRAVGVDAERFLDYRIEPRQILDSVAGNIRVRRELATHLLLQLSQLVAHEQEVYS